MKTAHYISGKCPQVIISDNAQPVGVSYPVKGKREAAKVAKEHSAKPWNF